MLVGISLCKSAAINAVNVSAVTVCRRSLIRHSITEIPCSCWVWHSIKEPEWTQNEDDAKWRHSSALQWWSRAVHSILHCYLWSNVLSNRSKCVVWYIFRKRFQILTLIQIMKWNKWSCFHSAQGCKMMQAVRCLSRAQSRVRQGFCASRYVSCDVNPLINGNTNGEFVLPSQCSRTKR